MPTTSGASESANGRNLVQPRCKAGATEYGSSHNAYTRAYFSRAILGPWGSLVYPWWFGTTRLRFKSGRTHYGRGNQSAPSTGDSQGLNRPATGPRVLGA